MKADRPEENRRFQIDDWRFEGDLHQLERGDEVVRLEPRVADLLLHFAMNPGVSMSRDDLMEAVWPRMVVGDEALSNAVNKLRKALGDDSHAPRFIETIPKVGYRFIAPVSAVENSSPAEGAGPPASGSSNTRNRLLLAAVSVVLAAILVLVMVSRNDGGTKEQATTKQDSYSLAVLPFESLGDDADQTNLADGLTEDLITDFSRLSGFLVIASTSTGQYRGQEISPQRLGKELNVDFLLIGSVRRIGDKIRVNARLVESASGFNKWAERYDRKVDEIFAVQNAVTDSVVEAFGLKPTGQERQRVSRKSTNNLAAYDHFLEGQRLSKIQTKEGHEEARAAYRKAIELDPGYGRAYGALAYSLAMSYRRGWTDSPAETIDRAVQLGKRGVELDDSIPQTYWSLGYAYMMNKELEKAEATVHDAVRIAPSYADGYGLLALINNFQGKPQQAIENITKGMRLNPFFTWDYFYNLGRAYYALGQYDKAIENLLKAKERNENVITIRIHLAASYIGAGMQEEAEWEIEEVLFLNPIETISRNRKTSPTTDMVFLDKFYNDLRAAGLPE